MDRMLAANLRDGVVSILRDARSGPSIASVAAIAPIENRLSLLERSASFPPLALKHKGQDETMAEFRSMLVELATSDSSLALCRHLVDSARAGPDEMRLASFWLSLSLLDARSIPRAAEHALLLNELYAHSLEVLRDTGTESELSWRFHALALEVVAFQARQHRTDFRTELCDALYPVVHLLGSPNTVLREHAITCLNMVAEHCEYASASDLVVSNADYLVNAIGLQLDSFELTPQMPQVLLMLVRLCGPSLVPFLDDLVQSIFTALDNFHGYPKLVELLFAVLRGIAEEGVKAPQLAIASARPDQHRTAFWTSTTVADVASMLGEMRQRSAPADEPLKVEKGAFPRAPWGRAAEVPDETAVNGASAGDAATGASADDATNGASADAVNGASADDAPTEPPMPSIFQLLLQMSSLAQHHLTSPSAALRTSLLGLLQTTTPALAAHDSSFLPLVHALWPVLVPRLRDAEPYVVAAALDVLALLCTHAGDFMRSRVAAVWGELVAVHGRTLRAARGGAWPAPVGAARLEGMARDGDKGAAALVVATSRTPASPHAYSYVASPARLVWASLVRALTAIVAHVAVDDAVWDEALDVLAPSARWRRRQRARCTGAAQRRRRLACAAQAQRQQRARRAGAATRSAGAAVRPAARREVSARSQPCPCSFGHDCCSLSWARQLGTAVGTLALALLRAWGLRVPSSAGRVEQWRRKKNEVAARNRWAQAAGETRDGTTMHGDARRCKRLEQACADVRRRASACSRSARQPATHKSRARHARPPPRASAASSGGAHCAMAGSSNGRMARSVSARQAFVFFARRGSPITPGARRHGVRGLQVACSMFHAPCYVRTARGANGSLALAGRYRRARLRLQRRDGDKPSARRARCGPSPPTAQACGLLAIGSARRPWPAYAVCSGAPASGQSSARLRRTVSLDMAG